MNAAPTTEYQATLRWSTAGDYLGRTDTHRPLAHPGSFHGGDVTSYPSHDGFVVVVCATTTDLLEQLVAEKLTEFAKA